MFRLVSVVLLARFGELLECNPEDLETQDTRESDQDEFPFGIIVSPPVVILILPQRGPVLVEEDAVEDIAGADSIDQYHR